MQNLVLIKYERTLVIFSTIDAPSIYLVFKIRDLKSLPDHTVNVCFNKISLKWPCLVIVHENKQ